MYFSAYVVRIPCSGSGASWRGFDFVIPQVVLHTFLHCT